MGSKTDIASSNATYSMYLHFFSFIGIICIKIKPRSEYIR